MKEPSNLRPKYPIYVISKGRWESRLTVKALERMRAAYKIVIEPQEYSQYAEVIDPQKILVLPFSNLGKGSIPARNWVWEHSIQQGVARHWILDDNIRKFFRLHHNRIDEVQHPVFFRVMEDFTDRYENLAISGPHYEMFVLRRKKYPPFVQNHRVYSCLLIRNDLPFRWRGRYNEDTDLCLRALKAGWCTVTFNAFLAQKVATMRMQGGNTDELYQGDGRLRMAQSLKMMHPDVVRVVWKWNRWHHHVDYSRFKQRLRLKPGVVIPEDPNEYGMRLIEGENNR